MKKILFVCMGNICRSSMAEGILLKKIRKHQLSIEVDSAGTHGYHDGNMYDPRARDKLNKHGIDVNDLRSRRIKEEDFSYFDEILAADMININYLNDEFGELAKGVKLITSYSKKYNEEEVPDPYYGGNDGFSKVYEMLDESIDCWLSDKGIL